MLMSIVFFYYFFLVGFFCFLFSVCLVLLFDVFIFHAIGVLLIASFNFLNFADLVRQWVTN